MIQKQGDYNNKTLQDCIDIMQSEKKTVLLHNGMVMGFEGEEKGSASANHHFAEPTKHIYSLPQTGVNCQAKMKR